MADVTPPVGRRASRKRLVALAVLGLLVLSVVAAVLLPVAGGAAFGTDAVAVVRLAGPIQESTAASLLGGGGITPALLRQRLKQARADPSVRAVVLRLDTGGGTVAASQEMAALVRDYPLPVVVSMGDLTASGGYYVASQADWIVAQPGTLTGSVGVIWSTYDIQGLLDKLGVELDTVTAGRHKDMFLPGRLTPERRQLVQQMVDQMYDQFVTAVAEGRGLPQEQVRELATGQLYTGQQALDLGLVDALGGLEEALAEAERLAGIEGARVVELTPSVWEQLLGGPGFGEARALVARLVLGDELFLLRQFLGGYSAPRYGG